VPDRRKLPIAPRMAEIEPFHVMELLGRAKEMERAGEPVIHMEVGEPDFSTPDPVLKAAKDAIEQGLTHYTHALGLPELREAISGFYQDRYQQNVDPSRIIITSGASGALMLTLGAISGPGDEVLVSDPGYPCNRHFIRFVESKAKSVLVSGESAYQLSFKSVSESWGTKTVAAMVATPSNPTGTVIPEQELEQIHQLISSKNGYLIVDEIYHNLTYDQQPPSAVRFNDNAIVLNSFSKYFCMTGWRLGWMVVPDALVRDIEKLAQNLYISPPTVSQYAAIKAFSPDNIAILEERRNAFKERRDYLMPELQRLGFKINHKPEGAFYLYADISDVAEDSVELANRLLEQAKVAVTPGIDFGNNKPNQHLRFAYTTSMEKLKEGIKRIEQVI
jgi:aspartate/methionine/tyrosine aminotransferase